jgi:hypothetical protein
VSEGVVGWVYIRDVAVCRTLEMKS